MQHQGGDAGLANRRILLAIAARSRDRADALPVNKDWEAAGMFGRPTFREIFAAVCESALHCRTPIELEMLGSVADVTANTEFHRASDEGLNSRGTCGMT